MATELLLLHSLLSLFLFLSAGGLDLFDLNNFSVITPKLQCNAVSHAIISTLCLSERLPHRL